MASSNRHWPSMFKSKPHQWHHDINHSSLLSGSANCHKSTFASGLGGGEERTPEPKPRWNPRPEQIRILESIFNSGMVNPPRDEIRKIRAQLQEYGQVGDANVFYWFQNRKSRTKHKQRTQSSRNQPRNNSTTNAMNANTMNAANVKNALLPVPTSVPLTAAAAAAATSSSSSSSEMSTGSNRKILPLVSGGLNSMMDSPTASVNQNNYFGSTSMENLLVEQGIGLVPGLWTELMIGQGDGGGNKIGSKLQNPNPNPCPFGGVASDVTIAANDCVSAAANGGAGHDVNEFLELGGEAVGNVATRRVMVLINGVMVEIMEGPLNVRQVFGELVLIHSSGHPVLTDEWGFTLHPLQHGASYYLI